MTVNTRENRKIVRNVLIDGVLFGTAMVTATVTQATQAHEGVRLFTTSISQNTDFASLIGRRIEFTYGDFGSEATFQGYVSEVAPTQKPVGNYQTSGEEIVCLGPSMMFKGNTPRFFTDVTCTQIIAAIVKEKQLGFNDEYRQDTYVWRTMAQTTETDWQMICGMAERIGCKVIVSRGVVRLIDPTDVMLRQLPSRSFGPKNSSLVAALQAPGSVLSFALVNLSNRDPIYSSPQLAFMGGNRAVTVQGRQELTAQQWLPTRFVSDMPVSSGVEAEILMNGQYQPDWAQEANVTVVGDATIEAGTTVNINTARARNTETPSYDGIWFVDSVAHMMDRQGFQSILSLLRLPTRERNVYPERVFWSGQSRGTPRLFPSGAGQWLSTWRQI